MKTQLSKIAFVAAFGFIVSFAQEEAPERLAVYAYGASNAGVNKSLSSKLLSAMSQSGIYSEIGDPGSFQDELAKNKKTDLASIIQSAKRYGSDYVCAVNITEVFGSHSITARLVKIANNQVAKTASTDHSLKSLEDLTAISNELARQLLPHSAVAAPTPVPVEVVTHPVEEMPPPPPPPLSPIAAAILAPMAPVAAQKQCARTYNINELLSKIKNGFPTQLKDCSSKLAKDMLNPFGKKLEPKSFMMQCPIDGIKKELPDGFPNTDRILGDLTNFVQVLMNSAMAGGAVDPKKLLSAVGSMNVEELLSNVKKLASDACIVDEPYDPPVAVAGGAEESDLGEKEGNRTWSFGIRLGFGGSYTRDYEAVSGMRLGFLFDIAMLDWLHSQPGIMYAMKGMTVEHKDKNMLSQNKDIPITAHYVEFPLLLSLKFSAFRLNAGPYFGFCLSSGSNHSVDGTQIGTDVFDNGLDAGLSMELGFDIWKLYIGAFYDYGIANVSKYPERFSLYNRTYGLSLGVNL